MAIIPVKNLSTEDILYGDRNTQYRWEVLEHSNGVDYLVGTLDGVSDGSLSWVQNAAVKGSGKMEVIDLDQAAPGMLRIADLELETCRIRPVMTLNAQDTTGSYQEVWTESRRNLIAYSKANGATPSGWSVSGPSVSGDWVICTSNGASTPYIFAGLAQEAFAVGDKVAGRITVQSNSADIQYIRVNFHRRTGNVYFPAQYIVPTPVGVPVEVQLSWTVTQAMPTNDLDISVVPCSAAGGFIVPANGSSFRASYQIVSRGTDSGKWFNGASVSPVPYRRYSWTGVANASVSIEEIRALQWVDSGQPVLPEIPWGTFLLESAKEQWRDTGRVWSLSMLDRTTVPSQDVVDESYAVPGGTNILQEVRAILASSGEYVAVDNSVTLATRSGMVWEAGTSKLKIINDLLDAAGYNSLWIDGWGNFQLTPRVLPADRSLEYELLAGVPRELVDGSRSIYDSSWTRNRDSFGVPNKVIAVQAAGGDDEEALIGQWTNEDPASPYSYPRRGRWIPHVLDSVDCPDGSDSEIVAFLQQRARATLVQMSAVQAEVKVEHLPIPVRVGDVLRCAHTKAGVDARHTITRLELDTAPTGLMKSTLQEVISL